TAHERLDRRRTLLRLRRAEVVYGIALAAFAVLALLARFYAYFAWDLRVARIVQGLPVPGLFGLMRVISWVGDGWTPYALTVLTALAFLACRRRPEAAGILLSAGVSNLLNYLLKLMIARPRPTSELVAVFRVLSSPSFPSGHVMFYVGYFGFLFFLAYALLP